ncbi:DUF6123 family protein [Aquibacillus sediminis]|uniref:DUF6123 family protein n=1 Tax=Aquibacillus sediminis TaxID=2574734 RepID=UPI00110803A1|nr:DUF6123 family protein [Aquibacillus sediminis]
MNNTYKLAHYLEDLWSKGFKLKDEEVRFIYFGKNYTNAHDWKIILAINVTISLQFDFDRSFFLSLLELFDENNIQTEQEAFKFLKQLGFVID